VALEDNQGLQKMTLEGRRAGFAWKKASARDTSYSRRPVVCGGKIFENLISEVAGQKNQARARNLSRALWGGEGWGPGAKGSGEMKNKKKSGIPTKVSKKKHLEAPKQYRDEVKNGRLPRQRRDRPP